MPQNQDEQKFYDLKDAKKYFEPSNPPESTSNDYENEVVANKQLRKDTDDIVQRIKSLPPSAERTLSIRKLQEGVMWLGMDLKRLGEANPYPSSKDETTGIKIEPTADGLEF